MQQQGTQYNSSWIKQLENVAATMQLTHTYIHMNLVIAKYRVNKKNPQCKVSIFSF